MPKKKFKSPSMMNLRTALMSKDLGLECLRPVKHEGSPQFKGFFQYLVIRKHLLRRGNRVLNNAKRKPQFFRGDTLLISTNMIIRCLATCGPPLQTTN